jgi:ABC-type multidrug transport system fused ATPase/permease subunit
LYADSCFAARTFRDNITYGIPRPCSDTEIQRACERARAWTFIQKAGGLSTMLNNTLSGGQKARIAIARVFLQDPPILLLDEPTAALDKDSEEQVLEALDELRRGRTCIIISHRLSTVRHADMAAVLRAGRCVEFRPVRELLADTDSEFYSIFRGQIEEQQRGAAADART